MVFYRKYRPQTIADLDLAEVRVRLTSILNAKEIPHAFLFTGPKGLGKTSSARILAKAINCERLASSTEGKKLNAKSHELNANFEPCNKCDACISITNGSNLDVLEIDAASNRGIDEIRDLREKIKFAPSSLPKKVYIIDEVHMLTTDAFNALLKTLEEPPSHAIFILCTTELEKVPPTIVSRAFHVTFNKPTKAEVLGSLARIVKGEKLDVEEGVLDRIFALSEGSFRDAAKVIEDLALAAGNEKITLEILEKNYKTESVEREALKLLDSLSKKNLKEAMATIELLSEKGADFKIFTEKLASLLHDLILAKSGASEVAFEAPDIEVKEAGELLSKINDSYKNIKFAVVPQLPLELVVVEWCLDGIKSEEAGIMDERKKEEAKLGKTKTEERKTESPKTEEKKEENILKVEPKKEEEIKADNLKEEKNEEPKNNHGALFRENGKGEDFFAALLVAIKKDNHSIAGILRGCKLASFEGNTVVFETKYKFHRDKLNEMKTREVLDARASEILREKVQVVVNLTEK